MASSQNGGFRAPLALDTRRQRQTTPIISDNPEPRASILIPATATMHCDGSSVSTQSSSSDSILQGGKQWEIAVPYDHPVKYTMETIRQALSNDDGETEDDVTESTLEDDVILEQYAFYHEGGTPLFAAIEESKWKLALSIAKESPRQIRTWIKSTGTVGTTFNWSVWQRLPIHEACRRQAPAWLVSHLLSVFPESAAKTTQFGELPLHLAVECGSAPEVVNLLVASNFAGIGAKDQSGRTPLEILSETELLESKDQEIVLQSLTRSTQTYNAVFSAHAKEMAQLKQDHADRLEAIKCQHEADLQVEQEQQNLLEEEVMRLSKIVFDLNELSSKQSTLLDAYAEVEVTWKEENQELRDKLQQTEKELQNAQRLVHALRDLVELKDTEVMTVNQYASQLAKDLRECQRVQSKTAPFLNATKEHLRQAVTSFIQACDHLEDHSDDLRNILNARGVNVFGSDDDDSDRDEKKSDCERKEPSSTAGESAIPLVPLASTRKTNGQPRKMIEEAEGKSDEAASPTEDNEVLNFMEALENGEEVPSDINGAAIAAASAIGMLTVKETEKGAVRFQ